METEHKLLRVKEKQLISNMAILPIVKSGQQQIQKKPGYCWPSWDERAHGKLVNRIWQCLSKCLLLDAGCYKPCSFRSIYGDFFQMKVNNFWNPAYSFFKPLWIFMVKNWYRAGISCTFIVPLQRLRGVIEWSQTVHGMARVQNEVCIPQLYRNCFNTVFLTRMNVYLAFECWYLAN